MILILVGSFPLSAYDDNFLILSDIHFNPLADQSQERRLEEADVQAWPSILSQTPAQIFSKSGEDTNWPLLQSVLRRAATLPDKPRFVLVTGDLFAHHLREQYERDGLRARDFASFTHKTALFLEGQFKAALPGVPVLMALGNNDGDCGGGDYSIEPGGLFLQKTLPAIADAARVPQADLEESWDSLGSYDIVHPVLSGKRIIVLDTTFLSWRYQNACGSNGDDPGQRLLAWFETRLAAARAHNQKVWLVYHIPPGIDGYASIHPRAPNSDRIVTLWNPRYQAEFEKALLEYGDTVQNQFAGHTHFDEFRLLGRPGAYSSFVLLNPGVSPNVRQNPALREARFRSDGTLTDLETWYLPLTESTPDWRLGYRFRREWKAKAVDLLSLSKLYSQIRDSSKVRSEWEDVYSVWSLGQKRMTNRDFAATACAAGNADPENFRRCFCNVDPSAGFCRSSSDTNGGATVRLQRH